MKAILFTSYGSPDVLQLTEVEKPTPKDNQVLVKVRAASANPLDWHHMRGEPIIARMMEGLLKPTNPMLGADIAGRVEAVDSHVTEPACKHILACQTLVQRQFPDHRVLVVSSQGFAAARAQVHAILEAVARMPKRRQ